MGVMDGVGNEVRGWRGGRHVYRSMGSDGISNASLPKQRDDSAHDSRPRQPPTRAAHDFPNA